MRQGKEVSDFLHDVVSGRPKTGIGVCKTERKTEGDTIMDEEVTVEEKTQRASDGEDA